MNYIVETTENGLYNIFNKKHEIICADAKNICNLLQPNLLKVRKQNNLYNILDDNGTWVLKEDVRDVNWRSELGMFEVTKKMTRNGRNLYQLVNTKGEPFFKFLYSCIGYSSVTKSIIIYVLRKGWNIFKMGEGFMFRGWFDNCPTYDLGKYPIITLKDYKKNLLTFDKTYFFDENFDGIMPINDNYYIVEKDNKYNFVDITKGQDVLSDIWFSTIRIRHRGKMLNDVHGNLMKVYQRGKGWNLFDVTNGVLKFKEWYSSIEILSKGQIKVTTKVDY